MMRRLARNPESLPNVFPGRTVALSCLCNVLTRDPCDRLTELESKHREIKVSRLKHGPIGFTSSRCGITHHRQPQISRRVQKRRARSRQCRLVEFGLLRRTPGSTCHDANLPPSVSFNMI